MRVVIAGVCAWVVACSALLVAQSGPVRREGKWEITTQMMMNGRAVGTPRTETKCVTKEQASDPTTAAPSPAAGPGTDESVCKITDQKITGNKVNWTVKCGSPMPLDMVGEVIFAGDTYTGTMMTNVTIGGQTMNNGSQFSGKRVGDCVK